MKKIITWVLLAVMCVGALALASCGNKEKIKYVPIKLTDEQYAFGVNKEKPAVLEAANKVIADLKKNGKLDEIVEKYFSGDEDKIKKYEAGAVNTGKTQLIVATNTPFAPFEYKEGTKYSGIDLEIAELIAAELGAELVIVDMPFDSILTAIEQGKADIAMAGLTVSEERKKQVNFSDTYYNASQVVIVKADDATFDACKTAADVEAILNGKTKDTKVGYQNGTTGGLYVEGDADWEFPGFPVTGVGYASAALAVQAMLNGQINCVVVDEGPAQIIVQSMNK